MNLEPDHRELEPKKQARYVRTQYTAWSAHLTVHWVGQSELAVQTPYHPVRVYYYGEMYTVYVHVLCLRLHYMCIQPTMHTYCNKRRDQSKTNMQKHQQFK